MFSIQPLAVRHPKTVPANRASTLSTTPAAPPPTHGRVHHSLGSPLSGTPGKENSPSTAVTATTYTSNAGKRPASEDGRPKLFSPRKKHAAQRPKRIEHVTISEDPPSTSPPPPAPANSVNLPSPVSVQEVPSFPSGSLLEDGADSGPKVRSGYSANFLSLPCSLPGGLRVTADSTLWKKQEVFQASRPLILERVATDFDEAHDPMEVQASIARYLIKKTFPLISISSLDLSIGLNLAFFFQKALNASHSLARRSDALDNACAEAREEARALRLQVQELIQKNEKL
ncbi:hypothetical protein LIER_33594 [Lithospermum erythrorhizon]|uniref:Uncharacterized protein n=1 Tax=Lithospermum erythrorhizon TaxID=34254 RepID=A0AAV3RX40_LITER